MNPSYTTYHPKWHRERMPIFWWLRRFSYTRFITRELTSLFVAYTAVLILVQVRSLAAGGASYARFEQWLRAPGTLAFHALVLVFLLIHSVTWLNLAPRAMVVRALGRRVPDGVVLLAHYVLWLLASGLVAWVLLGRRS